MSLQDKIRKLIDKQNGRVQWLKDQPLDNYNPTEVNERGQKLALYIGRLEGMAAALAILRNIPAAPSSVKIEIALSNQRCGYDND